MEITLRFSYEQILQIIRQMPEKELERLKKEVILPSQAGLEHILSNELEEYRDVFIALG